MKQTYMWGALVGLFIFLETIAGNKLEIFANAESKIYLVIINILTLGSGIYLALRDYKYKNDGGISFGRCMFNGVLISALAGVVTGIGSVVYFNYIAPEEKEKALVETETFLVQEKDSTAKTIAQYKVNFVKNYQDTVRTTLKDLPKIEQMASDSAAVIEDKLKRSRGVYTISGSVITNTGPFVIIGLVLSLLMAAIMSNKKQG
jgi:hypothetical protein